MCKIDIEGGMSLLTQMALPEGTSTLAILQQAKSDAM